MRKEEKAKDAEEKRIADAKKSIRKAKYQANLMKIQKKYEEFKKRSNESVTNHWNRTILRLDKNDNAIHPRYRKNEEKL